MDTLSTVIIIVGEKNVYFFISITVDSKVSIDQTKVRK